MAQKCMLLALLALAMWLSSEAATAGAEEVGAVAAKTISPELLRQDMDFLFKSIEEIHPNMYAYTGRKEFDLCRSGLYKHIDHAMTASEFYWQLAPVVASLKMGHVNIWPHENMKVLLPGGVKGGMAVFPLAIRLEGANVVLEKNFSSVPLPLGATVETINGEKASAVIEGLARCFALERQNPAPAVVQMPGFLSELLWLKFGPVERWTVRLKSPDGEVKTYEVESAPFSKVRNAQSQQGEESAVCTCRYVPEYKTAVLNVRSFGGDEAKFAGHLRRCFQQIADYKASSLIVDIRQNGGGSSNNADTLIGYLMDKPYTQFAECRIKLSLQEEANVAGIRSGAPQLFEGKKVGDIITLGEQFMSPQTPPDNPLRFKGTVLLLVDGGSYSTSTSFAACLKHFRIATLVGEETGDPTTCYGNIINVKLPNSGLVVCVPSRAFVMVGDRNDGRGVTPDHTVKQRRSDTAKGVDTVMQFALNLAREASATRQVPTEP